MSPNKHFRVEGLERRLFLSSAIAAFGAQQTFATGSHPETVAVADLNRDGKLDLAIANFDSGTVGVLLGNGNGTFQAQQTFAVGSGPYSVAIADINGDGKPDLVTANYTAATISVLLGNGDGTFLPQQTLAVGRGAQSVAIADVNGDGKPDVVVANFGDIINPGNTVSVLLGNGDGTFQPQRIIATGSGPASAEIADVNRDGKPDLIVTNDINGNVGVLLGNGEGTFGPQRTFGSMTYPTHAVVADLNGDGKLDLVVSSFTTNVVTVLLGNGDGTFGSQHTLAASNYANHVAVADVNGDGKPDIVVSDEDVNTVGVLLGNGDGSFQPQKTFATGTQPTSVATADVNGDGRLDIIVTNYADNTVSVLLGDVPPTVLSINRTSPPGPITSDPSVTYTVTFNEAVTGVDPTDFALATTGNVSATTPVVVTPVNGSVYSVTINGITGTGTLGLNLVDDGSIKDAAGNPLQPGGTAAFQPQRAFGRGLGTLSFAVADVNGDGKLDMVDVGNAAGAVGSVDVLLGNGDGTFGTPATFATDADAKSVAVADVNRDGKPDLIVADEEFSGAVSILLGNGNGTFQAQQTFAAANQPYSVIVPDVNGDGKPDIVVANIGSDNVSVLLGNGNGTFQAQQTFAAGTAPLCIAVADMNGDGKPDLVIGNNTTFGSVLLGNGDGTFRTPETFATGSQPFSVALSDVNGDGKTDILTANETSNSVSVLLGNGNGTFQAQQTFGTGIGSLPRLLAVLDVNGDGPRDVVVTNFTNGGEGTVGVLLGNGDGTFAAPRTFATGSGPTSLAAADLDGDGRLDLVVANNTDETFSLLLGNSNSSFTGQTYTVVPSLDTISVTTGGDQITLVQNPDNQHIDWTFGNTTAEMAISDPNGLTINGNGGGDVITLDYTHGNPLPNTVHLNGTFTVNGLQGTNPLLNTTLEMGRSTVYISYASAASDPIAAIKTYLHNGYNNGGWNGVPAASPAYPGAITSIPTAQNGKQTTAVGYADSADPGAPGIANLPANTIELKYTLYGDTTLAGTVGPNDFTTLKAHYNQTTGGTWDTGDFNYDGSINFNDFTLLTRNYNTTLGAQASPAIAPVQTPSTPTKSGSGNTVAPTPVPRGHRHLKPPRKHRHPL